MSVHVLVPNCAHAYMRSETKSDYSNVQSCRLKPKHWGRAELPESDNAPENTPHKNNLNINNRISTTKCKKTT